MGPLISHLYEKLDRIRLAILEFCPYIIDIPRLSILAHLFMKLSTNLGSRIEGYVSIYGNSSIMA